MSAKKLSVKELKTWVEISGGAVRHNIGVFRKLIGPNVALFAVVKSNAYGHGILDFTRLADKFGVDGFCVDSVFEGAALRKAGVKKAILVLGMTLPANYRLAVQHGITITLSNTDSVKSWLAAKDKPEIHLKFDTGMHRQGFFPEDVPRVIRVLKKTDLLKGLYTHFASAKDVNYPTYTDEQLKRFTKIEDQFQNAGYHDLMCHVAASGGAMLNKKYHLDMVRVGMGLYGYAPSKEIGIQLSKIRLKPVLKWKTVISEIKKIPEGSYVSYDLTEKVFRPSRIAILPIGYWHGYPWALSSTGEFWINGKKAPVLGRVTMDMVIVDVTGIACKPHDEAEVHILSSSANARTSFYEFLTRINPLMKRIVV